MTTLTGVDTARSDLSIAAAVRLDGIAKLFGSVVANREASLTVASGEIHALVGENGAGKSTLMRVLAGMYAPDQGTVRVNGHDVTGWSTPDAIAAGVGMVHQHFMLVPTLTVAENIILGREPASGLRVDMTRAIAEVKALSAKSGLLVDPSALVADLTVGEAQRVEILKALYRGARILILDEPTAVLSPPEVRDLWTVLRTLKESGGTIILITHKLDEVIAVSDTITVMRAGMTVSRFATAGTTPRDIARAMVGRDVSLAVDAVAASAPTRAAVGATRVAATRVAGLTVRSDRGTIAVNNVSFDIAPGEILGIAGVEGNGQTELLEAIAGLRRPVSGSVFLGERDITSLAVRERADAGLSHIPEDRHRRGLVLEFSIADNLILGRQHHFSSARGLDAARIARNAAAQIQAFDIRPPMASLAARALSGGNQQKIVIAREMGRSFTVLLAAQPTRGVDVGAIEFIHDQLRKARHEGKGILLVSADLPEIIALSDRVAVMYGGRFVTVIAAGDATSERLGPYMTGAAA
jgi:ABC-type uncharacterized transport system ATPase subunit